MRRIGIVSLAVLLLAASPVRADRALDAQARRLYQAGMAHFQLEEYELAIQLWQQGFKLKPAPEFLYNIAQAYRLSSERAAVYYQKYLNRYPQAPNRAEVERLMAVIKRQAAEQKAAETAPKTEPVATATPACPPPPPTSARPPSTAAATAATSAPPLRLVPTTMALPPPPAKTTTLAPKKPSEPSRPAAAPAALIVPATAAHDDGEVARAGELPLVKKKWFWATLGATAAVVAVGVGVGVGVGAHPGDPVASFGVARGN